MQFLNQAAKLRAFLLRFPVQLRFDNLGECYSLDEVRETSCVFNPDLFIDTLRHMVTADPPTFEFNRFRINSVHSRTSFQRRFSCSAFSASCWTVIRIPLPMPIGTPIGCLITGVPFRASVQ